MRHFYAPKKKKQHFPDTLFCTGTHLTSECEVMCRERAAVTVRADGSKGSVAQARGAIA